MQSNLFIEVNPFHEVTLYYYRLTPRFNNRAGVLGHARLFGRPLFDALPSPRFQATLRDAVRAVAARGVESCHFNTVNPALYPLSRENVLLHLKVVALAVFARLRGARITTIVHEADAFFKTGFDANRRVTWYRRLFGRWFIRLFDTCFVLSPEVLDALSSRGIAVTFLDPTPLAEFARVSRAAVPTATGARVCWIGPVVGFRRNWRILLDLDPNVLERLQVRIDMLCDCREGAGPELKAELYRRGLLEHFIFRDYRPDDHELFAAAATSLGMFALSSRPEYGSTKTAGARIIAYALGKPFVATTPTLGVYYAAGPLARSCPNLSLCLAALVELSPNPLAASANV
jgi:hypothetical protein